MNDTKKKTAESSKKKKLAKAQSLIIHFDNKILNNHNI